MNDWRRDMVSAVFDENGAWMVACPDISPSVAVPDSCRGIVSAWSMESWAPINGDLVDVLNSVTGRWSWLNIEKSPVKLTAP